MWVGLVAVEQCPCFSLGVAHRRALRVYEDSLEPLGLTVPQAHGLFALYARDGRSAKDLARELQVDAATMTPLLDRLEKHMLVRRCPDPGDRRATRVCLQERAHRLRPALEAAWTESAQRVSALFSADEYHTLMSLLHRLSHAPPGESTRKETDDETV
jgi:DNA-binding MarR family transcriptional regulator